MVCETGREREGSCRLCGRKLQKRCTGLHLHKWEKWKLKHVLVFVSCVLVRQLQPSCIFYGDVFLEVKAKDGDDEGRLWASSQTPELVWHLIGKPG